MKIALYRILGNDLPPRHSSGQTLENLEFILKHESQFEHVEKRWLLNRIENKEQESAIRCVLESHNQHHIDTIEYNEEEFLQCWTDAGTMPLQFLPGGDVFESVPDIGKLTAFGYLRRLKNLYLMNINQARNHCLEKGFSDNADWVFPWDGGCFLTEHAWESIYFEISSASPKKYLIVPLERTTENQQLLDPNFSPMADGEPQLGFSRTATERFDQSLRYGNMNKAALINRLGVPGRWQKWDGIQPWEEVDKSPSPDAGNFSKAGWVARLCSAGEAERIETDNHRWQARLQGAIRGTELIDRQQISKCLEENQFRCWRSLNLDSTAANPNLLERVSASAETSFSVTHNLDKTPYTSERLQTLINRCCTLSLDYKLNNQQKSLNDLAEIARSWFIAPATRMNPNGLLNKTKDSENGHKPWTGVIEFRNLSALLDALKILLDSETVSATESEAVKQWLKDLLVWLTRSATGCSASRHANHLGTCYYLTVFSLACFLEDSVSADISINRLPILLARQVAVSGDQPNEETAHDLIPNALLNLCLWAELSNLCSALNRDLWAFTDSQGRSLPKATECLEAKILGSEKPDQTRQWKSQIEYIKAIGEANSQRLNDLAESEPNSASMNLPPYWQLSL